MYLFIQLNYITNQFIDFHLYRSNSIIFLSGDTFSVHIDEVIYTGGTTKSVHISESRGVHQRGVQNKQNSLGGTGECSVKQVVNRGGVFRERGFTVIRM